MKIDLNPESLILGFIIAQGFFSSTLLLFIHSNRIANRFLSALLLLFALWICDTFFRVSGIYSQNPNFYFLPIYFSLAFGPLLWMYTRSLTTPDFQAGRNWTWHLLPAGLQFAFYLFLHSRDYAYRRWFWIEVHQPLTYDLELVLSLISLSIYLVLGLRQIRKYQRILDNEFSNTHRIALNWLRGLYVFILVLAAFWLIEVIARTLYSNYPITPLSAVAIGLAITILSGGAIIQRDLSGMELSGYDPDTPLDKDSQQTSLNPELLAQIKKEMEINRTYRNPELNLKEFSALIGLSGRDVSHQINAGLGMSFIDFVNSYRIEEVKNRIEGEETDRFTLLSLAMDSGFNAKSTFNRVFRKFTGLTPSEYQKSVKSAKAGE